MRFMLFWVLTLSSIATRASVATTDMETTQPGGHLTSAMPTPVAQ